MKHQTALTGLIPLIGLLALFAAGLGLFYDTPGQPYPYTSFRGEAVTIPGTRIGRIMPEMRPGQVAALDNTTTRVIQAIKNEKTCQVRAARSWTYRASWART